MSISTAYDRLLAHLQTTVTLAEFAADSGQPGLCALRHDVDHDLDIALDMAHREWRAGVRATYFLLPTAPYWNDDPRFEEKCLQLTDYGHEVGLHVNCFAQWAAGDLDDPSSALRDRLKTLRDIGLDVRGIAAHGDRRCYEHDVSNYWGFAELRPEDPFRSEHGRTAEGPYDPNERRRLNYPAEGKLIRADGRDLTLWSVSMADHGLAYHAWHTAFDRYFSDSGGDWTRTPSPMDAVRGEERWQVLVHPEYWRTPRLYFFLAPARSGSKWLSEVLAAGTSLDSTHEYVLNQDFHHGETQIKATSVFQPLEKNQKEINARLVRAWETWQSAQRDWAEVNVYLPHCLGPLRDFFPEATFVHLRRSPEKVVRSLMNRGWYDTPEDPNHPSLKIASSDEDQFGRICAYVSDTKRRLCAVCDADVSLEYLTSGDDARVVALESLGIAYHPRLGRIAANRMSNVGQSDGFPDWSGWTEQQRRTFSRWFGDEPPMATGGSVGRTERGFRAFRSKVAQGLSAMRRRQPKGIAGMLLRWPGPEEFAAQFGAFHCRADVDAGSGKIVLERTVADAHGVLTLGGSTWERTVVRRGRVHNSGWPTSAGIYIRGTLEAELERGDSLIVFEITYGRNARALYRRRIGVLSAERPKADFAFAPRPDGRRFDVAIYLSRDAVQGRAYLTRLSLEQVEERWLGGHN